MIDTMLSSIDDTEGVAMAIDAAKEAIRKEALIMQLWITTMKRSNIEVEAIRTFYTVCEMTDNGRIEIAQGHLKDRLGLPDSTTSRNVAQLSVGATATVHGPRLVESRVDEEYRRRKLIRLTTSGKRMIEAIAAIHRGV